RAMGLCLAREKKLSFSITSRITHVRSVTARCGTIAAILIILTVSFAVPFSGYPAVLVK
ncbi:hypothetical protein J6590_073482, partial [Homalodisca vitripennis]